MRARFVLNIAKDVLAPVNLLLGNPEAMKKLRETDLEEFLPTPFATILLM